MKLPPTSFRSIVVAALNDTRIAPNVSGEKPFTSRSGCHEHAHFGQSVRNMIFRQQSGESALTMSEPRGRLRDSWMPRRTRLT
jgi:hypothetical protein